jgi:hypothetical protein
MSHEPGDMSYDEVAARLVKLAKANGGTVTAAQVEADERLSRDRDLVSAAARALGSGTNVFSAEEDDGREWFPYSSLTFSELSGRRAPEN